MELFAEYFAPPPALFVFGAGDDARSLVYLAHSMGWEITVADGRSNLATARDSRSPIASWCSLKATICKACRFAPAMRLLFSLTATFKTSRSLVRSCQ